MRTALLSLALLGLLTAFDARAEGDAEEGRVLSDTCVGCHGVDGYTNAYPTYKVPKIAGQHSAFIVHALEAYRDGEREHPTMVGQSQGLSEQEIQDIAAYLASMPREEKAAYKRARSVGNPARGEEVAQDRGCAACHGDDGNSPEGMAPPSPILAGQYADYLYKSLRQYQDGTRDNAVMVGQVQDLSDRDMRDLAAFYASQPGPIQIMEQYRR
ncbi:cytochrome c553 [Natronospira proteinivora]|uniref:Cytochrome c553 n=1 Tax=Natronospira proteinivora TaxID=1807133 RepID=A0ABT1GAS9_9GAMM|nr:cytochrome c [Natronospira proteinivora]MCP1728386.1 cytochrome c553 [Natronospira proteinivora]